jgi:hypothetical protein
MSTRDLAYKGTDELTAVAASYTTENVMLIDANGNPTKDTMANFISKNTLQQVSGVVYGITSVVTLAELNAGKILIPAVTGKKIHVVGFAARCGAGNMAVATSFDITDDNGTAVPIQSIAVAAATANAYLVDGTTNVTRGAGYFGDCTVSKNVIIKTVGSAATTGASITVDLLYRLV